MNTILAFRPHLTSGKVLLCLEGLSEQDRGRVQDILAATHCEVLPVDAGGLPACHERDDWDLALVTTAACSGAGISWHDLASNVQNADRQCCCVLTAEAPSPAGFSAEHHALLDLAGSPRQLENLLVSLLRQGRLSRENHRLSRYQLVRLRDEFAGTSSHADSVRQQLLESAGHSRSVWICGEPGTGRNLAARLIHQLSRRSNRPIVRMDCSVLTGELMERELFGDSFGQHAPSSDTRLHSADGGTLVLEHVEHMPLPLQKKVANAFSQQWFDPGQNYGGRRNDVRLIATSRQPVETLGPDGQFRQEFLELFAEDCIALPRLNDRLEDLPHLVEQFLKRLADREGLVAKRLTVDGLQFLQQHRWPGNVTELKNVLHRACSVEQGPRLTAATLQPWCHSEVQGIDEGLTLSEMERKLIESVFTKCAGNRERTAQSLQIGLRTLSGKLRDYGYPPRGGPGSNRTQTQLPETIEQSQRRAA